MIESVNNLIVCEPYRGNRGIKSKVHSGVATIQQKTEVVGLKVLKRACISSEIYVEAGSTIYIKEEVLYNIKEYSVELSCKDISDPFVLVNFQHVVFIKGKNEA